MAGTNVFVTNPTSNSTLYVFYSFPSFTFSSSCYSQRSVTHGSQISPFHVVVDMATFCLAGLSLLWPGVKIVELLAPLAS
jgi:hypothetical protein